MKGNAMALMYRTTLFFITLSGFAQMPVFKRYYIADIPGLGWLAQFYVTHGIHYIAACVLLGLSGYAVTTWVLNRRPPADLTMAGRIKGLMITGLIVSGSLMVMRNMPGIYFSHMTIHLMNLFHLACCIALLIVSGITLMARKGWVR